MHKKNGGGGGARQSLVNLRAGFPAVGKICRRGPNLVWPESQKKLPFPIDAAHVRTEKFVGRAGKEIAVERANVNRAVRRVMNGVDERERPGFMSEADDFGDRINGADGIR